MVLEFDALLDPVFEEISTLGDLIAAAQSFSNRQEEIHEAHQGFISNLDGWKSLTPPPIAVDFYQRALEIWTGVLAESNSFNAGELAD